MLQVGRGCFWDLAIWKGLFLFLSRSSDAHQRRQASPRMVEPQAKYLLTCLLIDAPGNSEVSFLVTLGPMM